VGFPVEREIQEMFVADPDGGDFPARAVLPP
jgi:hypothetical protein